MGGDPSGTAETGVREEHSREKICWAVECRKHRQFIDTVGVIQEPDGGVPAFTKETRGEAVFELIARCTIQQDRNVIPGGPIHSDTTSEVNRRKSTQSGEGDGQE